MTDKLPIGLGLMCKPPRPGVSKTRLAQGIGHGAAAELSAALLRDCADTVRAAAQCTPLEPVAFYRPRDANAEVRALLGPAWSIEYADAGDLGTTMREIFERLLAACPNGAMIMGADIPLMAPQVIMDTARAIKDGDTGDVVIGPTADGGYCLIGLKTITAAEELFRNMVWSTESVLDETLRRAKRAGLRVTLSATQRDIDNLDDLVWLQQSIPMFPDRATHTRAALHTLSPRYLE